MPVDDSRPLVSLTVRLDCELGRCPLVVQRDNAQAGELCAPNPWHSKLRRLGAGWRLLWGERTSPLVPQGDEVVVTDEFDASSWSYGRVNDAMMDL